jgi:hypothetical protein
MSAAHGDNRLPELAAEIRRAHADVQEAVKTAAERAIAAGHLLIEARKHVKHGQWLPWLRDNCALAERTAQLYMQLARKGVEPAIVADLGMQAASKALIFEYGFYRPIFDGDEEIQREWRAFALFLVTNFAFSVEGAFNHIDWIGRHDFTTVDEWLGPEGQKFVSRWRKPTPQSTVAAWEEFRERNQHLTTQEIDAELTRQSEIETPPIARRTKRRAR